MPELPEVEVTKQGISPHIKGKTIAQVVIRNSRLRKTVPANLPELLSQQTVLTISRRAKYLIFQFPHGIMVIHLGMSGNLRIIPKNIAQERIPQKHDHIDFILNNGTILCYCDPRRFGMVDWFSGCVEHYSLFQNMGVEPLSQDFYDEMFIKNLKNKKTSIKQIIMNGKIIVGVGNIYANEALFHAHILPQRPAETLQKNECHLLVQSIKNILHSAINAGGSSLKDFIHSDGSRGYFQQQYAVYGRKGLPCTICNKPIESRNIAQRNSFYCSHCQK